MVQLTRFHPPRDKIVALVFVLRVSDHPFGEMRSQSTRAPCMFGCLSKNGAVLSVMHSCFAPSGHLLQSANPSQAACFVPEFRSWICPRVCDRPAAATGRLDLRFRSAFLGVCEKIVSFLSLLQSSISSGVLHLLQSVKSAHASFIPEFCSLVRNPSDLLHESRVVSGQKKFPRSLP